jgi:hypothetical protein
VVVSVTSGPWALLMVVNIGAITSRKAKTKLAVGCQRLNLWNVILLDFDYATISGRWGVCAATPNYRTQQILK